MVLGPVSLASPGGLVVVPSRLPCIIRCILCININPQIILVTRHKWYRGGGSHLGSSVGAGGRLALLEWSLSISTLTMIICFFRAGNL